MRLIDKDSLIEHMRKAYEGNKKNGFKWDLKSTVAVIETVDEINRPIVHCKDCKWWRKNGDCYGGFDFEMDADDFCSQGEKK